MYNVTVALYFSVNLR